MLQAIRTAFPRTVPVLFGYLFMGIAFGILLQQAGYSYIWAFFISVFVYAGSMQFVLVTLLANHASLITVAIMTLVLQFRHIFYGFSLIERFQQVSFPARLYLMHALTDETYSLHCLSQKPSGVSDSQYMLATAILDHIYWILGCVFGALLGDWIPFDTTGIDFAMTALFVVIFIEQWQSSTEHRPALLGGGCAILCLLIFGSEQFLIPALLATGLGLLLLRRHLSDFEDHTI